MTINQEKILTLVDKMPAFPKSAHRIIELSNDINCAPRDLVEVIEHDPVLTLKTLKLVNSSYFGLAKEITSVKHGVVYLGINTIKNVALSVAAIGALPKDNKADFDMNAFLWHSLLTGVVAKLIIKKKNGTNADMSNAFVAGLLHDIGKVVFVQFLAEEFKECLLQSRAFETPCYEAEEELIGIHHAEIGGLVIEKWQLPMELADSIRFHHSAREEASLLEKSLFVANQASKLVIEEAPILSQFEELPEALQEWIEVPLAELNENLPDLNEEIEKAKMFTQLG